MIRGYLDLFLIMMSIFIFGVLIGYQINKNNPVDNKYIFDAEYKIVILEDFTRTKFTLPTNNCGSTIILVNGIIEPDNNQK